MSDLACPFGSGSQASPEAPLDLRPSGIDPSREPSLAWLSAKAFPGPWEAQDDGITGADRQQAHEAPWYGGDIICDMPIEGCDSQKHWPANAAFIVAIVNAFREGRLVEAAATAQGIEARKGRDEGSVHESPVGHEAEAP